MKTNAIIKVYKKLIKEGKITGPGLERYNELVKQHRNKILDSSDSRRAIRARKFQYITKKDVNEDNN